MIGSLSSQYIFEVLSRGNRRRLSFSGSVLSLGYRSKNSALVEESFLRKIHSQKSAQNNQRTSLQKASGILDQADSALESMMSIATKLKDLAQLATEDSLQGNDRIAIVNEAKALLEEFDHIARSASYAGRDLLTGSFGVMSFGGGLDLSFGTISSRSAGGIARIESAQDSLASGAGSIALNDIILPGRVSDGLSTALADSSALAFAAAINSVSDKTGITAEALTTRKSLLVNDTYSPPGLGGDNGGGDDDGGGNEGGSGIGEDGQDLVINGTLISGSFSDPSTFVNLVNQYGSTSGVYAKLLSSNEVEFYAPDGRNIHIQVSNSSGNDLYQFFNVDDNFDGWFGEDGVEDPSQSIELDAVGAIRLSSSSQIKVSESFSDATGIAAGIYGEESGSFLADIDLSSVGGAQEALSILDSTVQDIEAMEARVGALHSRVDIRSAALLSSISALSSSEKSLQASREALDLSDRLVRQIQQENRTADYFHRSLNTFRIRRMLEHWSVFGNSLD